jgi:hypothetical protein
MGSYAEVIRIAALFVSRGTYNSFTMKYSPRVVPSE